MLETGRNTSLLNVPGVVKITLAWLVFIHAALYVLGPNFQSMSLYLFAFIPARLSSAAQFPQIPGSAYWSMITYSFLHGDIVHLLLNCLWFVVFGTPIARRFSPVKFFTVAAAGSIAGALATLAIQWGQVVILVGASAAVSALMAASVPLMFGGESLMRRLGSEENARNAQVLRFGELLQHRRAIVFILVFFALTLFTGASQLLMAAALVQERNVAWEAHLAGFIAGLLTFYAIDKQKISDPEKS